MAETEAAEESEQKESAVSRKERFLQQKLNKTKPKFILCMRGFTANISSPELVGREQSYLTLNQIQQLLMSCFIGAPLLSFKPDWFILERCLKASKVAIFFFDCDKVPHKRISPLFKEVVRFTTDETWLNALFSVQLTKRQMQKKFKPDLVESIKIPDEALDPRDVKTSKLDLLLSADQMLEEGYLFPDPYSSIIHTTRHSYEPVTEDSPLLAIDCEMCITQDDLHEVTRISMVDEDYQVLLDTYVKPKTPIKDYLTRYSGVTKEILDPITVQLEDIRKILRKKIPRNAILCGQSLNNDLKALKMFHPYVIDTSVIFNNSGTRCVKVGLKNLTMQYLGEDIQGSKTGHCSVEDATATMKLVRLKLESGLKYGDNVLGHVMKYEAKATFVPFKEYLKLFDIDVDIFYDYTSSHCLSQKFISVFTSFKSSVMANIFSTINESKSICLLLTKDGFCYINV